MQGNKVPAVLEKLLSPPVTVTIEGKEYSLVYDMQATILYEEKTGASLFDPGGWDNIHITKSPKRFLACLWAGLQRKHPEVSFEQLSRLNFKPEIGEIMEPMARAVTAHFPKAKAVDSDGPVPNVEAPAVIPIQPAPDPSTQEKSGLVPVDASA